MLVKVVTSHFVIASPRCCNPQAFCSPLQIIKEDGVISQLVILKYELTDLGMILSPHTAHLGACFLQKKTALILNFFIHHKKGIKLIVQVSKFHLTMKLNLTNTNIFYTPKDEFVGVRITQ